MNPDLTNLEERIDADRRKREEEILLLLLLLFGTAYRQSFAAVRVGTSPVTAVGDVLMGNPFLGFPGGASRLARLLAQADIAGFRRTLLVLPTPGGPGWQAELDLYRVALSPTDYLAIAQRTLARMLGTLQRRIALRLTTAARGVQGTLTALREAFTKGGYLKDAPKGPWHLEGSAIGIVNQPYQRGYVTGFVGRPLVRELLTGFRYSAIIDGRTSDICTRYHETKLPVTHEWWSTHWPQNHERCRSSILPIFGVFRQTDAPINPPPETGYGEAPAINFQIREAFENRERRRKLGLVA